MAAILEGEEKEEWEQEPQHWNNEIKHLWQACSIKTLEIAVTAWGILIVFMYFSSAEGETDIILFMNDIWPSTEAELQSNYLSVDKACKIVGTMDTQNQLTGPIGWIHTTNLKVETWHFTTIRSQMMFVSASVIQMIAMAQILSAFH
ncbi:hypothetical protein M422DRAFT_239169 [Sphaerobolus stellatus SS14]|nr:hypothetical protein M422DRAFT_239169 [Sphaerobolus stellatus SS14]